MGQTCSHVEFEHDPFIKRVSRVVLNLASIYDLFMNELIVSSLRVL